MRLLWRHPRSPAEALTPGDASAPVPSLCPVRRAQGGQPCVVSGRMLLSWVSAEQYETLLREVQGDLN